MTQGDLLALLPPRVAEQCQRHAEAIRVLGKRVAQDIIEIGTRLIEVKSALPHGAWLPWIEAELGWSIRTVQGYMNVAEQFGKYANSALLPDLTIDASALIALSGPSVAPELREAVIEKAEDGTRITREEADRIAAEMVARKTRELTEQFNAESDEIRESARAALTELRAKVDAAMSQRPPEPPDAKLPEQKADPEPPTVADAVSMLLSLTGQKKLKPAQIQALALALGKPIAYGDAIYPPATQEATRKAEEALQLTSACQRAMDYFHSAPPAADVVVGMPDWLRNKMFISMRAARVWIDDLEQALKDK